MVVSAALTIWIASFHFVKLPFEIWHIFPQCLCKIMLKMFNFEEFRMKSLRVFCLCSSFFYSSKILSKSKSVTGSIYVDALISKGCTYVLHIFSPDRHSKKMSTERLYQYPLLTITSLRVMWCFISCWRTPHQGLELEILVLPQ